MAKEVYYFSHDANARNDTKILSMRCDYGLEGYGMYWVIIECMREEENYKLMLNDNTYRALAMQMHCKIDTVEKFIKDCIEVYGLFQSDGQVLWSNSLLRRMEKMTKIREKRRAAAAKRWDLEANAKQMDNKSNANALQNDAKENKRKEKENINIYSAFFEEMWSLYPNKKGKGKISETKKKEIYKLGDEFKRCINRYIKDVEKRRKNGFPELNYQNGSTFFNNGYIDYLDKNYQEKEPIPVRQLKPIIKKARGISDERYTAN